jgi:UDP-2,3-diacylglucosamine pyrophosphatase LpxH
MTIQERNMISGHHDSVHTLIVSDVHLGSRVSRAKECLDLLESFRTAKHHWNFKQLILLGDIFDDLNFTRLGKHAWQLVSLFREITDEESNARVIWILGNHDELLVQLMAHLVGIKVHEEFEWTIGAKRFFAMHGQQFDKWIINWPNVSKIPSWIYDFIQQVDGSKQRISRFVKDKSKTWLHINAEVANGIVNYASKRPRKIDAAFCGHTHIAESIEFADRNMWYYNTGCWTGKHPPTYVTISVNGEVHVCEYVEESRSMAASANSTIEAAVQAQIPIRL